MSNNTSLCPICYDPITKETGNTTLSCSHSYHLACISRWFDTVPSCPCCRSSPSSYEIAEATTIQADEENSDEDEEEVDDYDLTEAQRTVVETLLWIQNGSGAFISENTLSVTFDATTLPWPNVNAQAFIPS